MYYVHLLSWVFLVSTVFGTTECTCNRVMYGSKIFLQVNSMDYRWLSGGRGGGNPQAVTRNHLRSSYEISARNTYQWIVRSTAGTGLRSSRDPKQGKCLRYGDAIYLQVNNMKNRWLSGGRGGGNHQVVTRNHLKNSYEKKSGATYQWIVRSEAGKGKRLQTDKANGMCVLYQSVVYLQVRNLDDRWLTGGRGHGNAGLHTRNHQGSNYEKINAKTSYEWIIRNAPGIGKRTDSVVGPGCPIY